MSRHSPGLPLDLEAGVPIRIGGQPVVLTCTTKDDPDKMVVKEIYVSRSTGRLVIVYNDEV